MKITLRGLPKKYNLQKRDFLNAFQVTADFIQVSIVKTKLNLLFTTDAIITKYHEMYLNDNTPTDVITFPMMEEDPLTQEKILGDLLISFETAERESAQRKIPIQKELILYAIHGFLHLHGYDDHATADRKKMHRTQDQILKKIFT